MDGNPDSWRIFFFFSVRLGRYVLKVYFPASMYITMKLCRYAQRNLMLIPRPCFLQAQTWWVLSEFLNFKELLLIFCSSFSIKSLATRGGDQSCGDELVMAGTRKARRRETLASPRCLQDWKWLWDEDVNSFASHRRKFLNASPRKFQCQNVTWRVICPFDNFPQENFFRGTFLGKFTSFILKDGQKGNK